MSAEEPAAMGLTRASLIRKVEAAADICSLDFELDEWDHSSQPRPGQFYQVDCGGGKEHMLRRPLGVHRVPEWDGNTAVVTFLVQNVGWGTSRLCSLEEGNSLSLLGPLGRGFDLEGERALLVAGGMGIASIYFLASEMGAAGHDYLLLAGFSSKDRAVDLGGLAGRSEVFTEDGSLGRKGMVSEGVADHLGSGEFHRVLACGPEAMMKAVSRAAGDAGVRCMVSLDSRMACGVGACRGCVKEGTRRRLCVCTDGPVFDAAEVVWR